LADIFISYSSHDREKAEQLTELLISAGLSVWIDKHGIGAATSWSGEITRAISDCKALVVMLSPSSVESKNVVREVSLAFEKNKKILPLDLEPVTLTDDLAYHLAGLQRTPMTNIDAIIRALGKLGFEATQAPSMKLVKETDGRKSLMILPFEDLSPTADNGWFADGIVSEMISSLSNVKSLRVADSQATKEFKTHVGSLSAYAKEMGIRYFVQGDVRKFGDHIKITSRLLDIETGDHLWQDSLKGTMEDIFDIQETVAQKVVAGLNIILTKEERSKLDERRTESVDAYECYIRGSELFSLNTKEGVEQTISLLDIALSYDPNYIDAILGKAMAKVRYYRSYDRDIRFLREAEALLRHANQIKPDFWEIHANLANMYIAEGRREDADREHQLHIAKDDGSADSQSMLGFYCFNVQDYASAFRYYERSLNIEPRDYNNLWNAAINAHSAGDQAGFDRWSAPAIAAFRKRLRLHPEDSFRRYNLTAVYLWSDPSLLEEGLKEVEYLRALPDLDPYIQGRIAYMLMGCRQDALALEFLAKALASGREDVKKVRDPSSPFAPLYGHPDFEKVMRESVGQVDG
jgi:TolB-like protein